MEGITINYTPKTPQFAQSPQCSVHPQGQINFSIQNNNMVDWFHIWNTTEADFHIISTEGFGKLMVWLKVFVN